MLSVADLAKLPTSQELRACIGQPLGPCARCGNAEPIYNVLKRDASLRCVWCDSGPLNGVLWPNDALRKHVAFQVAVVDGKAAEFQDPSVMLSVVSKEVLNAMWPMCPACGCRWYVEAVMSDGTLRRHCWVKKCGHPVGDEPVSKKPPNFRPMTVPRDQHSPGSRNSP